MKLGMVLHLLLLQNTHTDLELMLNFILANSMGTRQINFDASLIEPTNTLETSNLIP